MRFSREFFTARITLVWLHPRVNNQMFVVVRVIRKSFVAVFAFVGFVGLVHEEVDFKVCFTVKYLATFRAGELFDPQMDHGVLL